MSRKMKESFPGQPEDKDIVTGVSTPFKQANREHDENVKNAEEAIANANKEAVDLVYGDNTKKKEGKFKNDALKKMHLSENLFKTRFDEGALQDTLDDPSYDLRMGISDFLDRISPIIEEDKYDKETILSIIEDELKAFYKYYPELNEEEKEWADYKERCSDCPALVEEDGEWYCDEAKDFCEAVVCCPEGLGCLVEELELNESSVWDKISQKVSSSKKVKKN